MNKGDIVTISTEYKKNIECEIIDILEKSRGKMYIYKSKKGYVITEMKYNEPKEEPQKETYKINREYDKYNRERIILYLIEKTKLPI